MDPSFKSSEQIKDTLTCLLCQAVICYKNRDKKKFVNHMRRDHGAFYNIGLILIINLLDKGTSIKLIQDIYREKYSKRKREFGEFAEMHQPKEAFAQTEPSVADAEVQTDFIEDSESKFSGGEFLSDLQHFVSNLQLGTSQMTDQESWEESEKIETSADDDLYIPSDVELDEAIPSHSTPNSKDVVKIKQEKIDYFIPPDSSLDPIEIFLDGEDFNILDVTKEDLVLTPGGPMQISDYSNFQPGALIPPQYDPSGEVESPAEEKFTDLNDRNSKVEKRKRKPDVYSRDDSDSTRKLNTKEKDLVCLYLREESQYFKKTKNEVS